jgi:uncharacterized membrane protein
MDFIGAHWWLWLIVAVALTILFLTWGLRKFLKVNRVIGGDKLNTADQTALAFTTMVQLTLLAILAVSSWIMFFISMFCKLFLKK